MAIPKLYIHSYDLVAGGAATVEDAAKAADAGASFEQSLTRGDEQLPVFPLAPPVQDTLARWRHEHCSHRYLGSVDRLAQLGCFAARRFEVPAVYGAVAGTSRGVSKALQQGLAKLQSGAPLSPKLSPTTTGSALATSLGHCYRLSGMTTTISAACSSGLHALGVAASLVRTGTMPGALVAAAEACLDPFTIAALLAAKVHSRSPGYQPLSPKRSGLALAEGAAALTISAEAPKNKGTAFELAAFASCRETATMTGISANAEGLKRAIRQALSQAGVTAGQVDLIVSHGAGTVRGDAAELKGYSELFGGNLPAIQHYKWLMGHSLGATGLQALVLALYCRSRRQFITAPYFLDKNLAPRIGQQPTEMPRLMLACSLGFGGICSAVLIRCHEG